jgi:hypothetical protein
VPIKLIIYMCMFGYVSTIILFDCGIIPTMWLFFVFHFNLYRVYIDIYWFLFWWYDYIFRFRLSLPVCLDPGFCSHSSIYIYAIIALLVLFFICVKLVSNIYIIPELCLWLEYTWTVGNDEPVVKERRK